MFRQYVLVTWCLMSLQAKHSEEKAKKAMVDAGRLTDELRAEQDHTRFISITSKKNVMNIPTRTQDKAKRALECQLSEMEHKCVDANENAIRGGCFTSPSPPDISLHSFQDVIPWQSLKPESVNWRLNLGVFRQPLSPNSFLHIFFLGNVPKKCFQDCGWLSKVLNFSEHIFSLNM